MSREMIELEIWIRLKKRGRDLGRNNRESGESKVLPIKNRESWNQLTMIIEILTSAFSKTQWRASDLSQLI